MFKTESKILKWMGNKYINEIVTKDINRFLKELQESLSQQTKSYATVDKVKLDTNGENHYLILQGNKRHKSKLKEVIELIVAHLENEFKIHTKFNLNKVRYGGRGGAGWEGHREFSILLNII